MLFGLNMLSPSVREQWMRYSSLYARNLRCFIRTTSCYFLCFPGITWNRSNAYCVYCIKPESPSNWRGKSSFPITSRIWVTLFDLAALSSQDTSQTPSQSSSNLISRLHSAHYLACAKCLGALYQTPRVLQILSTKFCGITDQYTSASWMERKERQLHC